jgi:hypothetical protein
MAEAEAKPGAIESLERIERGLDTVTRWFVKFGEVVLIASAFRIAGRQTGSVVLGLVGAACLLAALVMVARAVSGLFRLAPKTGPVWFRAGLASLIGVALVVTIAVVYIELHTALDSMVRAAAD